MKWIHVKALFESENISFGEELVSDLFFTLGLKGVVCQVPLEDPPEGFGSDALPVPDQNWVSGYIPDTDASLMILENIKKKAADLAEQDIKVEIETQLVDQEDWAESWKNFFHVSRITNRIVIKPAWREFDPNPDDIVIEIDPGMAFGTGTHPTTSMCISLIEKYLTTGNSFFDIGTGSGILMIAAAKLGASKLVGIDTDEIAVQVATENIIKNRISPTLFHIETTTLGKYIKKTGSYIKHRHDPAATSDCLMASLDNADHYYPQFDLIAANIIAEVLIEIMPDITRCVKTDGIIILSGIIKERETAMTQSLDQNSFSIIEIKYDGEWIAMVAKKVN